MTSSSREAGGGGRRPEGGRLPLLPTPEHDPRETADDHHDPGDDLRHGLIRRRAREELLDLRAEGVRLVLAQHQQDDASGEEREAEDANHESPHSPNTSASPSRTIPTRR